jgi:hypothetical protein
MSHAIPFPAWRALAARGYWQALQVVKQSDEKLIGGENAGARASQ